MILNTAAEHEESSILTCVERVWRAYSGPKAESVGLIVISRSMAVQRADSWTSVCGWKSGHGLSEHPFPAPPE